MKEQVVKSSIYCIFSISLLENHPKLLRPGFRNPGLFRGRDDRAYKIEKYDSGTKILFSLIDSGIEEWSNLPGVLNPFPRNLYGDMTTIEWPWQYGFPPFFTLQPNAETRAKQIAAWRNLVLEYHSIMKQGLLDTREAQRSPLFSNSAINRKLPQEGIVAVLEDLARTGNAEPLDKTKNRWHIYWHTLDEWGDIIYTWVQNNGMVNTVCTLFELSSGDTAAGEEFSGLDTDILIKALQTLESKKKAELIFFDDNQGVKFF